MLFMALIIGLLSCTINGMSSYPYISGDTFRSFAHHVYDERHGDFNPARVRPKDIVFVKTDFVEKFFARFHPQIPNPYLLITHNSDDCIPGTCARYLDDPKLIAWFGQNMQAVSHPKLHPIPIGIANQYWPHGNVAIVGRVMNKAIHQHKTTRNLLYMNMAVGNNVKIRQPVYDFFSKKSF